MDKREILKYATINSLGTALYIVIIALFLNVGGQVFPKEDTALTPVVMLMLFVFSAAITGSLVFGRPILWYLDNKKKQAIFLLIYTLGIFLLITIIVLFIFILTI